MPQYWTVPPLWRGRTAFLIGGGTSVTPKMLESVRGRDTVAINMSYIAAPWASILFFADLRFWDREMEERRALIEAFPGVLATTCEAAKGDPRLHYLRRIIPEDDGSGMSLKPDTVSMASTSLQGAMNLCYHLGSRRIVLLGADNRDAPNGRIHYHEEYPWTRFRQTWDVKMEQFGYAASACKRLGVEVINCSPISTLPFWPIRPLADVLSEEA